MVLSLSLRLLEVIRASHEGFSELRLGNHKLGKHSMSYVILDRKICNSVEKIGENGST